MKILFVSPWFPWPAVNGSKQRIHTLLTALAKMHQVHLISFVREGEIVDNHAAEQSGISTSCVNYREFQPRRWKALMGLISITPRSILDTYHPDIAAMIEHQIKSIEPDLIIFSQAATAAYNRQVAVPSIFEEFEISTIYELWTTGSNPVRKMRYWLTWKKQAAYLRRLVPRFQHSTVVSVNERNLLNQILPDYRSVTVIPNGVDLEYNRPGDEAVVPSRLVYSGALTYAANLDAVSYFLAEILPIIQKAAPQVELYVTGSYQGADIRKIAANPAVRLTGYVEDLRPLLRSAAACVVPLQKGGGTRLKILEAMALGVPVVSTPKGAEGLAVAPEENLLIGEDPEAFARQVIRLLTSPDLRARLAERGRRLVETYYDWDQISSQFCQLAAEVGGRG